MELETLVIARDIVQDTIKRSALKFVFGEAQPAIRAVLVMEVGRRVAEGAVERQGWGGSRPGRNGRGADRVRYRGRLGRDGRGADRVRHWGWHAA